MRLLRQAPCTPRTDRRLRHKLGESTKMLDRILLASVLIGTVWAADPPRQVVYSGLVRCGGCLSTTFDKGYVFQLIDAGHAPSTGLAVYGPTGMLAYQVNVLAPDGTPAFLNQQGVAADTDGTVILAMWYGGYGGFAPVKGGGVVVLDPNGKQVQFIDTARYMPNAVCFAPDHSVWMLGTQFGPKDGDIRGADYSLVRHYLRDGKQFGAFLSRASFAAGLPPGGSGMSWMRAAGDRIGMMAYPGMVSDTPTWVELDLQGKEIGRWKLGASNQGNGGWGYTSDGRLFAWPYNTESKKRALVVFDKASSTWQAVSGGLNTQIMGADGSDLVFLGKTGNGVQLVWASVQ